MMKNLFFLSFFLNSVTAYAQEADTLQNVWHFDITGGSVLQNSASGKTPTFRAPDYLTVRRPTEPAVANMWGLRNNQDVTDNPLGHGPMYIRPHVWYRPVPALTLYASLEIDHRGASWGPYNTENIALLPRFHGEYSDWKRLKNGDSVRLFGKMGYLENYRNFEGLVLYNIDVQGFFAGVQYGKVILSSHRVGDLIRGYGLGIDGMTSYQVEVRDLKGMGAWKTDLKAGLQKMIGYPATGGDEQLLHTSVAWHKDKLRVYSEFAYRNSSFPAGNRNALLIGFTDSLRFGKWKMNWRGEYRYYGGGFNYQFRNESATHFRDVNRGAGSNLIGTSVYPMSFYGRSFSQWAVFTEYDKPSVQGLSLFGSIAYPVGKNIDAFADFDLNYLLAHGEDPFVYPFYNSGVKMYAMRNTYLALSVTNKTMNLDKHYTTYYYVTKQLLQLELRRTL